MMLSVKEAAEALSLSPARIRKLIEDGKIRADKVGSQWILDELEVKRYRKAPGGRPAHHDTAWGYLNSLEDRRKKVPSEGGGAYERKLPQTSRQTLERWTRWTDRLLSSSTGDELLINFLSKVDSRAERRLFTADRDDIPDLRSDPRIVLAGVSHPSSGLLTNSEVEAYVDDDDVESLRKDFFLIPAKSDRAANVILHVADEIPEKLPLAAVAADLAEHHGPREQDQATKLLRNILAG